MTTTVAQAHRHLVAEMDEAGDKPEEIAKKLGISVDRVEAILDQLDESDGRPAHPDDEHRAPAVEPVRPEPRPVEQSGPIVVGSPARAPKTRPVVAVRPVPEPADEDLARLVEPADEIATSELVATDQQLADVEALRAELAAPPRCGDRQGTYAGYAWHSANDDQPPCEPCMEARRAYNRDLYQRKAAASPKPKRAAAACGTLPAYYRHRRNEEAPCDPCAEVWRKYKRTLRAKNGQPEPDEAAQESTIARIGPSAVATLTPPRAEWDPAALAEMRKDAVAFLLLPLSIPRLVAVTDALELAYGPDLRVVEGPGGMWVLGRAS